MTDPAFQTGIAAKSAVVAEGERLGLAEAVTDERIERAIWRAGIAPDICEWSGDPWRGVTFRVGVMGRYAKRRLTPWMDDDSLAFWVGRVADDYEAQA